MLQIFILITIFTLSNAACPNMCSGKGFCDATNSCTCFDGVIGADCSLRSCPEAAAWVDVASASNTAHADAECSNMGTCDQTTGQCSCRPGFEGSACERFECPSSCSNHGTCLSMRETATTKDNFRLMYSTTYTKWDADKIYGCVCDHGWTGYDCSQRVCPRGDDPLTTGQVTEIQTILCSCATTCSGTFTLSFRGEITAPIPYDTSANILESFLEHLSTVNDITVSYSTGTKVCDAGGITSTISFNTNHGDLPSIEADIDNLASSGGTPTMAVTADGTGASREGTTEDTECNGRGTCSTTFGTCTCDTGFASSDGLGATGSMGDCGYEQITATTCALANSVICNGHGTCSGAATYICTCDEGYLGIACSERSCPYGLAWFDEATATDTAHALAECSNKGVCSRTEGTCTCQTGFTGSACERLFCPVSAMYGTCNGKGTCLSMKKLGLKGTGDDGGITFTYGTDPNSKDTWDADRIHGCYCDSRRYYYPGVASGEVYGYKGYDCSERTCPHGDDPMTDTGVEEQQTIRCTGTSGSFTVSFRGNTSTGIGVSATAIEVEAAIEAMKTVGDVTVTMAEVSDSSVAAAACSSGGVDILVSFNRDFGDLPLMTDNESGAVTVTVAQTQAGTKETTECSNRGICNRSTGECKCFKGYISSDGYGNEGKRRDCGGISALAWN